MLRKHAGTGIHTEISGKNNRPHIFNEVNNLFLIWKTFSVLSQKEFFFTVSICQLLHSLQNCFLLICHNRHLSAFLAAAYYPQTIAIQRVHNRILLLSYYSKTNSSIKKELTFPQIPYIIKNSSSYTSELFLILIWRCTQEAEGTALEMRQAGQPVRGFKSLHLRSFFVKFFIIKMHNKLDNRCFYMYNCNSKRNFTSWF